MTWHFARTVAKAACRASDPAAAAERFITDYNHILDDLTKSGTDPAIARSLASIASVAAEPLATAHILRERYTRVLPMFVPRIPPSQEASRRWPVGPRIRWQLRIGT